MKSLNSWCMGLILSGWVFFIAGANAGGWVDDDDDAKKEITPVYVMTHTYGQNYTFVRADFWFWDAKKSVKLKKDAVISVNGLMLEGREVDGGYTYTKNIPISEGKLTFKLTRTFGGSIEHTFELPKFDLASPPQEYRPYESLRVPVNYLGSVVGKTAFNMDIVASNGVFPLSGSMDRDYFIFRPIVKKRIPSGIYDATIYVQQRVPLNEISSSKSGWAVVSNGQDFNVRVLNDTD